ncbi:hypothetical protein ACO34A_28485 (plasmid) [Rhizobium sp. ACO-34A]|nr:nitrate reductase cytochrome c-type subunit [Rhizobium sp. ACO-34A]ATN37707.1 hypothetical protein ACO34A_28485 [Rhizobium sp. ACO-34A]
MLTFLQQDLLSFLPVSPVGYILLDTDHSDRLAVLIEKSPPRMTPGGHATRQQDAIFESIGSQLSVNTNRCLSCHKRELTEGSGAPMISVTHYMTREGQMLADVSPRRYFCTACHVPQADAKPLVDNSFKDMSELGFKPIGSDQ